MYVLVESARAVVAGDGAEGFTGGQPCKCSRCRGRCRDGAGEAIQLHGGIAITWEHDIQLYFKRAHGSAQLLGAPDEQLRRLESQVL